MYAEVVVLTYQAPDISSFAYEVPKELEKEIKIGQLVEVPFGKRNPMGIVINLHKVDPSHTRINLKKIRPVSSVLLQNPILLTYQIEILKWTSAYYIAPLVNCLEAILPPLNAKQIKVSTFNKVDPYPHQTLGQFLILVPSLNRIPETLAKFPKAKNYVVYHNELKPSEKFTAWMKILSGNADYIFGSRSAIFTPCPKLKEIIIYDEHDNAYKDERSPYFDTLTIAQKISELTRSKLWIVDPAPRITTYSQLPKQIKIQKFTQKVEVVDMQKERLSNNKSAISFDLESNLNELNKGENALLFLNKIKESGHLFCKACKTSVYLEKRTDICPNCKSTDIFWNELNVNSLAVEVKKMFPKSEINLLTENSKSSVASNQRPGIDIGTAFALYASLGKKYDLVAHIQTDTLINQTDFTSGEKLFAQITSLKKLLKPNGKLILQTYNMENSTINLAAKDDYKSFFEEELAQRKALSYPPYSQLVKLTIKGKSDDKVKKEAEQVAANLQSKIYNLKPTLLGPYRSIFWQKQTVYHIILKYKLNLVNLNSKEKAVQEIAKLIGTRSYNWQITVDPQSIY